MLQHYLSNKKWLVIIAGITFSNCTSIYHGDIIHDDQRFPRSNQLYRGGLPNEDLIGGIFLNSLDPNHDTLVLAEEPPGDTRGHFSWNRIKLFFLLTKDVAGNSKVIRGIWQYRPEFSDWTGNQPAIIEFKFPHPFIKHDMRDTSWIPEGFGSHVFFRDSTKNIKILVIDTLLTGKPSDPKIFLNSEGKPFRFEKKIELIN